MLAVCVGGVVELCTYVVNEINMSLLMYDYFASSHYSVHF